MGIVARGGFAGGFGSGKEMSLKASFPCRLFFEDLCEHRSPRVSQRTLTDEQVGGCLAQKQAGNAAIIGVPHCTSAGGLLTSRASDW